MYNGLMQPRFRRYLPWLLVLLGALSLGGLNLFIATDEVTLTGVLLVSGLVGLLALSPIPLGSGEVVLAHAITIAGVLTFGPADSAVGLLIGLTIGEAGRAVFERESHAGPSPFVARAQSFGYSFGQHGTSLAVGTGIYLRLGGSLPIPPAGAFEPRTFLSLALGYLLPMGVIQWLSRLERGGAPAGWTERLTFFFIIGLLPIPYAILTAFAGRALGETALLILGGGPAIITPILRSLLLAEGTLKRRVEELSTLSEVSQAMRTSLNLEAILHTIYLQVAHLLQIRNFYVALFDPDDERLSYPLAIRDGERDSWPDRPLADRLTDRVIQTGEPILIAGNAPQALREMGLPEIRNAPASWMGVPLQTPSRVLGCIGVFYQEGETNLTAADRDLLTTLAGQASVAIENALLYQQTRRRAKALASLNEITTQMSSSLDPEQTLHLVAHSLTRAVGGEKAAIYLTSEDGQQLDLAQSTGLPAGFRKARRSLPLTDEDLTRAYHERRPVVVTPLAQGRPAESWQQQLISEGISRTVDVPMTTPAGPIGLVTVFFAGGAKVDPEQLELLETFVAQSAIAVANARAHAATDQALERQVRQLSRLEGIGREMLSTLDPAELFEAILDSAMAATGSRIGHLIVALEGGDRGRLAASRGYPTGAELPDDGSYLVPAAFGLGGKALESGQTLNVRDVRMEPEHIDWSGGSTRSLLSVPLGRWGRSIGAITVEGEETDAFSEEEVRFLSQVAAYAAVAITNAELYQQLEDNLREQSLLYQASAQIATSMDVDAVAMAVADSLVLALEAGEVAVLKYVQGEPPLQILAKADRSGVELRPGSRLGDGRIRELAQCLEQGMPRRFQRNKGGETTSALAIPLQVGADSIGVLEVTQDAGQPFTEAEIRTAQTIASQAAIALQNTELFRRIQASHDRLIAVLNSTREAILMVDEEGRSLFANQQFETIVGVDEASIIGARLFHEHGEIAQKLGFQRRPPMTERGELAAVFDRLPNEQTLYIDQPQERVLQRLVEPVQDAEGGRIGWLLILRDITEERELAETRDQLTEMIVHDLRGPLTTIRGSLALLARTLSAEDLSETTAQALKVSERSVSQMLGLVNSLLDLARLEGDPLEINRTGVHVAELCQQLAESHIPEANDAGLILETDIRDGLPTIQADEEKLRRVLANLLDNALKFTPEGGRIVLAASCSDGSILLTVADTGPGVPAEMRERIFDRFAQLPSVDSRRRGTGLGLAFAKLAVEAHGGKIWVEDSSQGGSAFWIELPLAQSEASR